MLTFSAGDEQATQLFGTALAKAVKPGNTIALVGPLGAGKTTLVRALAVGLGVAERNVSSPTFVMLQQYEGRVPIYHFDAYRVSSLEEFLDLGSDEYFHAGGVAIVEWANRVPEGLPDDRLTIQIEITGAESRTFAVEASGPESAATLERLAAELRAS
jgi:tRNA threonylcarbamoyladenosine biosynthesis protein TsaE